MPSSQEKGASGTEIVAGVINEEYLPRLAFPLSIDIYDEMRRSDASVRSLLFAMKLPIMSGNFFIQAASDDPLDQEIKEFCEYALFEKIIFRDFLRHALLIFDFGFMLFEPVFTLEKEGQFAGKYVWKKLAPRLPKSVHKWETQEKQEGITQVTIKDGKYKTISLKKEELLHFSFEQEGDNLEGVSVLRSPYKHWFYKNQFYKIQAMASETNGIGIPTARRTQPGQIDSKEKAQVTKLLKNLKSNEHGYLILPYGWEFYFASPDNAQGFDFETPINHHDRQISKAGLAQFIEIGITKGGNSQNMNQQELFYQALIATAKMICEKITKERLKQLVDFNYPNVKEYPSLKVTGIQQVDIDKLFLAIERGSKSGMMTTGDLDTENQMREIMGLPTIDEEKFEKIKEEKRKNAPKFLPKMKEDDEEKEEKPDVKKDKDEEKKEEKKIKKNLSSQKRKLYVKRDVLNSSDIIDWAKSQGLKSCLRADDFHVTIAFSNTPVDWEGFEPNTDSIVLRKASTSLKSFGDDHNCLVLAFESSELKSEFDDFIEGGASWDHDDYQPHITITYKADSDIESIIPYSGDIILGKQIFEDIDDEEEIAEQALMRETLSKKKSLSSGYWRELTRAELAVDWDKYQSNLDTRASIMKKTLLSGSKDYASYLRGEVKKFLKGDIRSIRFSNPEMKARLKKVEDAMEKSMMQAFDFGKTESMREIGADLANRPKTPVEMKRFTKLQATALAEDHFDEVAQVMKSRALEELRRNEGTPEEIAILAYSAAIERAEEMAEKIVGVISSGMINSGMGTTYDNFKDLIWGYQFSAILDERTSYICLSLDGLVARSRGDLPVPPVHFYCRSRLVAILIDEEEKPEVSLPDKKLKNAVGKSIFDVENLKTPIIKKGSPAIAVIKKEIEEREAKIKEYKKQGKYKNRIAQHEEKIKKLKEQIEK